MNNEKLKESFIDERTGIEYNLINGFYIPNLVLNNQEEVILNKYGKLRLKYLRTYKKAEYDIMFIEGTLNKHLKETQEIAQDRVDLIIKELKEKSGLTEDMKNTDMLYWVGTMNAIANQAEEIILRELIYI